MNARSPLALVLIGCLPFLAGCASSTPNYSADEGPTAQVLDNGVRYGSIAVAGAGGYLAGKQLTGSSAGGLAVGGAAALATYGFNKYSDSKRSEAYNVGYADGTKFAREEIVNEVYRREAIYGIEPTIISGPGVNTGSGTPEIRQVYVPARTINGVDYPATTQDVPVYK
jgi:hypothetical protein